MRSTEPAETPSADLVSHLERAEALLVAEWDWLCEVGDEEAWLECGARLRDLHELLEYARGLAEAPAS